MKPILIVFLVAALMAATTATAQQHQVSQKYTIRTTWDSDTLDVADQVHFTFKRDEATGGGIRITFNAPWYDDPLPNAPPGKFDGLWDYEVVEVFFLGDDEKYLELEFGPGGHYLAYYLEGARNVTKSDLLLNGYEVRVDKELKSWTGSVVIPQDFHWPPNVNKFNAYAIHGVGGPNRVYSSLFPVGKNETAGPNFHLLSAFKPIHLSIL